MGGARRCATCGSPLDGDQRYCLTCGERDGERSPQLRELMQRVGRAPGQSDAAVDGSTVAAGAASGASGGGASGSEPLRLPGPRMSALLVAVFVGFGALVGSAAGGGGAVPARAVRLLAPPSQSAGTSPPGATGGSEEAASEVPEAESEATPTPIVEEGGGSSGGSESASARSETSGSPQSGGGRDTAAGGGSHNSTKAKKLSAIKHVFVIVLSNQPYAALFGPESSGRYLAGPLERKGELLVSYDAIAHEQLPNGIALISGQGPTAQTAANCPTYTTVAPASPAADGQVLGDGCVYPASIETLPGQLAGKHLHWRAYVEGIAEGPGQPGPCAHPTPGAADATLAGGAYATFRDPFVYFESIVQSPSCQTNIVGLSQLKADLASASQTPSLAYIVPDRCHDAGPTPCSPGAVAGPAATSTLLEQLVPQILASAAYKRDGLLVITADEAPSAGELADSSSCCGQPSYPNYTSPLLGQGGGQVGALLFSPFVKGGTTSQEPYDYFSLLRTIEDIFGVPHLGYAGLPAVKPFAAALLNG